MNGTDEITGKFITGEPYLKQSVRRVLRTQKKSIIMHRSFGTSLYKYSADNITEQMHLDIISELADALETAIPEIRPEISVSISDETELTYAISGTFKNNPFNFEGL